MIWDYLDESFIYRKYVTSELEQFWSELSTLQETLDISNEKLKGAFYDAVLPENFFDLNWTSLLSAMDDSLRRKLASNCESIDSFQSVRDYLLTNNLIHLKFDNSGDEQNKIVTPIVEWKDSSPYKHLKDYQLEVFIDAKKRLEPNLARVIIQMPTGSGKTRTALEIVSEFLYTGVDVLWLCNTEELVDQAFTSFVELWSHKAKSETRAVNHSRTKKVPESDFNTVHFSTLQGLWSSKVDLGHKFAEKGIEVDKIGLIVFDEAHMSIASTYQSIVEHLMMYSSSNCRLLGLTATPGRRFDNTMGEFAQDNDPNKLLSDFYNNQIVKIGNDQANALLMLRSKKVLSELSLISIESNIILQNETLKESEIDKILANDRGRNKLLIASLIDIVKENGQVMVFANSVSQSKLIAIALNSVGIASAHVDGSTNGREQIINKFKANKISVITNYNVLSTGFDYPKLKCVFIARKTKSVVLYSQMIGRVLRGLEIGGTEKAYVYTINDNISALPNNDDIFNVFDGYFSK